MDEQDPNKQQPTAQTPPQSGRVVDDYAEASRATAEEEYDNYSRKGMAYTAPGHRSHKLLVWILIIVLLAAAGFAGYWFLSHKDKAQPATSKKPASQSSQQTQTDTEAATIDSKTKHYASAQFGLEFDYPDNWTVAEGQGSGMLMVLSPAMQLKSPEAKPITGQVVFEVRSKQQQLPEFDKGNAVASLASLKIDYDTPSSVQRGSTYLSFLRYADSNSLSALDGIFVTGDVGYQNGQAIPKADLTPVDPVISISFNKCADSACNAAKAVHTGIDNDMWQQSSFSGPLTAMLKSLVVN